MKSKYKIWDIISVKTYRFTLISPIIAIRDYGDFLEYVVNWMNNWFTDTEILGKSDLEWNIIS